MLSDQKSALQVVKKILTADFACDESDLDKEGVTFHHAREVEGARRFPLPEKFLALVTMGRGVVVSCSTDRLQWAHDNLNRFTADELFYASAITLMQKYVAEEHQVMIGPELKYICTQDTFRPYSLSEEIKVKIIKGEKIQQLYENNWFPNALGYHHNSERPRLLACLAEYDEVIVGLAAASADCDSMWQVGIDTLPGYRNRGIGKALVSRLTEGLFELGKLPYYATGTSSIASRRIAISLGYRPAWVEIYSREPSSSS